MKRRSLLGTLAGVSAGLAGCIASGSGVTNSSVEHVDPKRHRKRRPTIVAFDEDAGEVHIIGHMQYGSSSCNRIGIGSTRYNPDEGTLKVVMTSKDESGFTSACTADMAATWYRAIITISDSLPETVTVVEDQSNPPERRTVNRSEQRELCTTAHPPDSDAAEKAHWTCPERYIAVSEDENTSE